MSATKDQDQVTKPPQNRAAWLMGPKAKPLVVDQAPYPSPKHNEVLIQNRAVAINPVDWTLQENGTFPAFSWLKYPIILGCDVAGEVVKIGSGVTRFNVGDRVVGYAVGQDKSRNNGAENGFQEYTLLLDYMSSPIPDAISYERACVSPLGLSTAACGLFQDDMLALQLPFPQAKPTGKTVLIWGGSTSVGCNAIQLAAAAGYEVITTCSPRNYDLVKRLGAAQAFDYNSNTVVRDIIDALQGKLAAGALSIGAGAADACFDILSAVEGNKFVAMATYPVPAEAPKRFPLLVTIYMFLSWSILAWIKSKTRGFRYKFIFGLSLMHNEIGPAMFEDYLPRALMTEAFVPEPEPIIVGKGVELFQDALDYQKKGVSARKVVVQL